MTKHKAYILWKNLFQKGMEPETTMIYTHVARKDLMEVRCPLDRALDIMKQNGNKEPNFLISRK